MPDPSATTEGGFTDRLVHQIKQNQHAFFTFHEFFGVVAILIEQMGG